MHGSLKLAAIAAVAAGTVASASIAQAAGPGVCSAYAASAVQQQNKNLALGCGYAGPRWMKNYPMHYAWCIGAPLGAVQFESQTRAMMLAKCGGGGPPPPPPVKTFYNPKYNNLRVDWCYTFANACGAPAAQAFCNSRGFPHLINFSKANNVGLTRMMGNNQVCNSPGCDSFQFITCGK